jgi:hypothetical protein
MSTTIKIDELDFNETFNVVLDHYETKLKEAEKEIARFIKGYLGKRTIANIFIKASRAIEVYNPILHYSAYEKSKAYEAIKNTQAITFLNEYASLPRMMIRKGIVFKDYFDFISLIENKEYQCISANEEDDGLGEAGNIIETTNEVCPGEVFESCKQNYCVDAELFAIIYLDAKIMRYVESKEQNIQALTYRALLKHSGVGLVPELRDMKSWFEHNINLYINWNNFNKDYSNHPWGDRKTEMERRIAKLRLSPDYHELMKVYLNELNPQPQLEIMTHFDKILNREFKLRVMFLVNNTIELSFTWDCVHENPTVIKPPRKHIGTPECAILKTLLSKDEKKRILTSSNDNTKPVSDINIYFWQTLLIGELITCENKSYTINKSYRAIISTSYGRSSRNNAKRRSKKFSKDFSRSGEP